VAGNRPCLLMCSWGHCFGAFRASSLAWGGWRAPSLSLSLLSGVNLMKSGGIWTIFAGLSSPSQGPSTTPLLFQGQAFNASPSSSTSPLMPTSFQHLMRQVMDELRSAGFVLPMDLDMRTNAGVQADALEQTIDQVLGLRGHLNALKREFKDPDGTIAKLKGRIKSLEDRRGGDTIKQGGKTFQDVTAVTA
jgi:hypothetical protein